MPRHKFYTVPGGAPPRQESGSELLGRMECRVIQSAPRPPRPRGWRLADRLAAAVDAFRHPWKVRGATR